MRKILLVLSVLTFAVSVAAQQRISSGGGEVSVSRTGQTTIKSRSDKSVNVTSNLNVTGTITASGGVAQAGGTFTGQVVVTRDPASTTNTAASVVINPATSASNEFLLGVLDNGTSRFTVDKEGDVVAGASFKVGSGTVLTRLAYYTATLTPAEVAANTCAEELFTVTGITAGDVVFVNKPTAQAGLGVAGIRASAANQVGINFCNNTVAGITPTAAEVYLFGAIR
jgi:hypothetical protein